MIKPEIHSEALAEVYHSLRSVRRCYVVQLMAESNDEKLSIRVLAEQIAALEEGTSPQHVSREHYRNVYNSLSQTHLSTLGDADLIIYDPDRQTTSQGPRFQLAVLILTLNSAVYHTLHKQ